MYIYIDISIYTYIYTQKKARVNAVRSFSFQLKQ